MDIWNYILLYVVSCIVCFLIVKYLFYYQCYEHNSNKIIWTILCITPVVNIFVCIMLLSINLYNFFEDLMYATKKIIDKLK